VNAAMSLDKKITVIVEDLMLNGDYFKEMLTNSDITVIAT